MSAADQDLRGIDEERLVGIQDLCCESKSNEECVLEHHLRRGVIASGIRNPFVTVYHISLTNHVKDLFNTAQHTCSNLYTIVCIE